MNQDKKKAPSSGVLRAIDTRKVNQMSNSKNIRPIKPGQAVRSGLDGTLGVTTSIQNPRGWITVMFVGSIEMTRFRADELTVIDVAEVAA